MTSRHRPFAALVLAMAAWSGVAFAAGAPKPISKLKSNAATASPARPAPGTPGRVFIDGVADTGQFLPDSFVICRVGPRVTRVKDFIRLYYDSYAADRPAPDSAGRVVFLDNIVTKDVLGQLAQEINHPFGFEDRVVMREFEQRMLSNALYKAAVLDSLLITDAEVEQEYELFKTELRLRRILFAARATAVRVRGQLKQGMTSWQAAYDRYSQSKGKDKGPDGELGWASRGTATLQQAHSIFTLGTGALSEPIEEPDGWSVVQVVDRRPGNPPLLHALENFIRGQLTEQATRDRSRLVRDLVRNQIGMVYDSTNIAWAAGQFRPTQETSRDDEGIPNIQFNTEMPHFEVEDTSRVLARHRDGVFTLGRFFDLMHGIQPLFRPNVSTPESFREQVDAFAFEPYMARVAEERGLRKDSLVVTLIAKKREELLVQHLYADSVQSRISVDPQERRRYYEANKKGFITWTRVRYATMWAESQARADSFAALLRGGEKAEDILAAQKLLGIERGRIGEESENDHNPYHKVLFEDLRPGQVMVTGPDKVGHFLVLQKLEQLPGVQLGYDEVAGYIDESLSNESAERLLKALVDRHRKKYPTASRPDLVMRVRLVDPTL